MKMRFPFLVALALLCVVPTDKLHAQKHRLAEDAVQRAEQLIRVQIQRQRIPGLSAAIAIDNKLVWSSGFGRSDIENSVPAHTDTVYRTASIAKPMTAVAVLKLFEQGKLNLDESVQEYCPHYPQKEWPVTPRQLLGHLGGIRHYNKPFESVGTRHYRSVTSAVGIFANDPLLHEPGTKYHYTTFGYNLLGAAAENVADTDFGSLLDELVFTPANMDQTTEDNTFAIIPNRTRGYVVLDRIRSLRLGTGSSIPVGSVINAELHDTSMKIPGGGVVSTAPDLVRFTSAINTGRLLKPETVRMMWTEQSTTSGKQTGYGLGWRIGLLKGHKTASHSGGQAGTSTYLLTAPETGLSVAVMCNLQGARLGTLTRSIASMFLPLKENSTDYGRAIARLRAAVRYEVEQKDLPAFSIAIVDSDKTVWSDGFGYQDARKTVPATADTILPSWLSIETVH